MAIYTSKINVEKWFPDKSDLVAWVYDIAKYLQDTPIPTEEAVEQAVDKYLQENPITGNFYSPDNPPPYPVTSVNGKTGAVTGLYGADNEPPYPVTSVNGKTGAVEIATGGLSVSNANSTTPSGNNTNNVTLTLNGYVQGKYKMIFVMFKCKSANVDASIKIQTGNGYTIIACVSDGDGQTYSPFADGICCYPTALYDGNTIKFVANKTNAEIYTAQVDNFWWGVE